MAGGCVVSMDGSVSVFVDGFCVSGAAVEISDFDLAGVVVITAACVSAVKTGDAAVTVIRTCTGSVVAGNTVTFESWACVVLTGGCSCDVADTCFCAGVEGGGVDVRCLESELSLLDAFKSMMGFDVSCLRFWGCIRSVLICSNGLLSFVGFKENLIDGSKFFSIMSVTVTSDLLAEVVFPFVA